MMKALAADFRDLIKCFNDAQVRYLLIGGYAVNYHGHHRNTADIDFWIAADAANAERVSFALQRFGFGAASVAPEQFTKIGEIHSFGRKPFRVDLLTAPSGVEFESCYTRREEVMLDDVSVAIISLEDLKANKLASGRDKDLLDVKELPPE